MRSAVVVVAMLVAGCGARTDLGLPASERASARDAATTRDARADATSIDATSPLDAPPEIDASICRDVTLAFGTVPPTVVLVLDRSGSMRNTFREPTTHYPFPASRWEVLLELLIGPGLVQAFEDRVELGCATYSTSGSACPAMTWVPPALGNAAAIASSLRMVGPGGGTPTAEAIRDVVARLGPASDLEGGAPVLLLATDGDPTGCGGPGVPTDDTVAAVRSAHDAGIDTYVISVGSDTTEAHLQAVADAGRGVSDPEHAEMWLATNASGLSRALREVIASAASCRAELPSAPDPDRVCEATITIDDAPVPCGGPDGFRITGTTLELSGAACDRVRDGAAARGLFPCGVLPP